MKAYVLERSQKIAAPLEKTFRFFADPGNLTEITPTWLNFQIVKVDGLPLRAGSEFKYRIRWLGMPRAWRALITEFEPPRRFVDVQVKGPYRLWRHEHTFEDVDGKTLMRDRVEYEVPCGLVGRIVHWALVSRQLRQIFDYRAAMIRKIFPSES